MNLRAGGEFVLFSAHRSSLEIVAGGTVEILDATILSPGHANVPYPVFHGLSRALRFNRKRAVNVVFSQEPS